MQLKRDDDDNTSRTPESNYSNEINPNYNNSYGNGGFNNPNGGMNNNPYGGMNNNPYGGNGNQGLNVSDDFFNTPSASQVLKSFDMEISSWTKRIIIVVVFLVIAASLFFVINRYRKMYAKAEYIPGTCVNNVYKNEYFNIQIALEYGWTIIDMPDDPEVEKTTLDKSEYVIELSAANPHTGEIIGVIVTQAAYSIEDSGEDLDKIMDVAKGEYKRQLEQQGYNISNIATDNAMINGELLRGFKITGTAEGTTVCYVLYFDFKQNYVAGYVGFGLTEYQAKQTILDNIKPLN